MRFLICFLVISLLSGKIYAEENLPYILRKCPKCGKEILQEILLTGDPAGSVFWSDGKIDAPLSPERPRFVKCPGCATLFWIDEAPRSELPEDGQIPDAQSRNYLNPEEDEYYAALNREKLPKNKEIYLRFKAWHVANDQWRGKDDHPESPFTEKGTRNLQALAALLNERDQGEAIMKAEIARELGDFQLALSLLDGKFDPRIEKVVDFIRRLCREKNSKVQPVKEELFRSGYRSGNVKSWLEISIWCILGVFCCIFGIHTVRTDKKRNGSIVYDLKSSAAPSESK